MSTPAQRVRLVSALRGSQANAGAIGVGVLEVSFEYMPDSFRIGVQSEFERIPIPMTSAQLLVYQHTAVQDVTLTITAVSGMWWRSMVRTSTAPVLGTARQGHSNGDMSTLARILYAMASPEDNDMEKGVAPPRTVLQVGNIFGGVGAVSSVDIDHKGPWDEKGAPTDMTITVTFTPSNMYEPGSNRVGVAMLGNSPTTTSLTPNSVDTSTSISGPGLNDYLVNNITVKNIMAATRRPYVIQIGEDRLDSEISISRIPPAVGGTDPAPPTPTPTPSRGSPDPFDSFQPPPLL